MGKSESIQIQVYCPHCNKQQKINFYPYINFDESPQLYEKVKKLDLFKYKCPNCAFINYLNCDCIIASNTHKYILYFLSNKENLNLFENQMKQTFSILLEKQYKKQDLNILKTRVIFSLNDLLEKITILQIGLNDKAIQFIKKGLFEKEIIKNKNITLLFDGIQKTDLIFVYWIENQSNPNKINVNIQFYNKIIEKIKIIEQKQKKELFELVNQDWVKNHIQQNK